MHSPESVKKEHIDPVEEMRQELKCYIGLLRTYLAYPYRYDLPANLGLHDYNDSRYKYYMFRNNNIMVVLGFIDLARDNGKIKFTKKEKGALAESSTIIQKAVKNRENLIRTQKELEDIGFAINKAVGTLESALERLVNR